MANVLILPGFGSAYTSESFTASSLSAYGTDKLDLSRCASFAVQVNSSGAGTIVLEQSFNGGSTFALNAVGLGSTISVASAGTVATFDATKRPFGMVRINAASISAGTGITFTIVGFELPVIA